MVGELLDDQEASRLGIDQLLPHPVEGPAQRLAIRLALQMDERRQHAEQHLRLRPGELEMAAEHRDPAAVVQLDQRALAGAEKVALPILGRQGRIACNSKRPTAGQQDAVALLEKHRLASPLHGEPARA